MEDEKTLQRVVGVDGAADAVDDGISHFFADGVVTARIVVCSVLGAADQRFGVEERFVRAGPDLVDGLG